MLLKRFDIYNNMFDVCIRQHTGDIVGVHVSAAAECTEHIHSEPGGGGHIRGRVRDAISHHLQHNGGQVAVRHAGVSLFPAPRHSPMHGVDVALVLHSARPLLGHQGQHTLRAKTNHETSAAHDTGRVGGQLDHLTACCDLEHQNSAQRTIDRHGVDHSRPHGNTMRHTH